MNKGSKVLLIVLVVLLLISISFAYYRFFITKDYTVLDSSQEE